MSLQCYVNRAFFECHVIQHNIDKFQLCYGQFVQILIFIYLRKSVSLSETELCQQVRISNVCFH